MKWLAVPDYQVAMIEGQICQSFSYQNFVITNLPMF